MWYLLIPVVCFVLLIGVAWVISLVPNSEKSWKGRIKGLDVILSVLMTAKGYEPLLIMKVPRRVTWLKATFPESAVRCEVPLITRLQRSRKERYLALLHDLNLKAQVSKSEDDQDILRFQVDGPPVRAAAVIKEAFLRLFEVDATRALEFRATANLLDWNVIEHALQGRRPGDKVDLPVAATQSYEEGADRKTRVGCLWSLASLLLLPLPFMIAYLEFGFVVACAVWIAISVSREAYRQWTGSRSGFEFYDFTKTLAVGLAGTAIYLNDPLYLQLIPTTILSLVAVAELHAVSLGRSPLSLPKFRAEDLSRPERLLLSFAILTTYIGAVVTNEILRANVTLDTWVWFFAFVRIELLLGLLISAMPFIIYQVQRDLKEEEIRELRGGTGRSGERE